MVKVTIVQPALPAYRVPVFEALGRRPGIEVSIAHGVNRRVPNSTADNIATRPFRQLTVPVGRRRLAWISAQIRGASPKESDVLVLEWNLNNLSLIPALIRARNNGVRTVLWGHGYSQSESAIRRALRAKAGRLADGVVFYDRSTAREFADEHSHPVRRVFVAQNTIDRHQISEAAGAWTGDPERLAHFRQEHGIENRTLILHVSRIRPERHLDVLIRAMATVRGSRSEALAVVLGSGEPERTELRNLAATLGVEDSVRFVNGIYEEEELAPWFLSSLAFCAPSHLGLSVFHAFGYGLPVVAGNDMARHPPEARAIEHRHNGMLFEHDNPEALASVITELIDNREFAKQLGSRALSDMTQSFTIDRMVNGLEAAVLGHT